MKLFRTRLAAFLLIFAIFSCDNQEDSPPPAATLQLSGIDGGDFHFDLQDHSQNASVPNNVPLVVSFNTALLQTTVEPSVTLSETNSSDAVGLNFAYPDSASFTVTPDQPLKPETSYTLSISNGLKGQNNETFAGVTIAFTAVAGSLNVQAISIDGKDALNTTRITDIPLDGAEIVITFSQAIDESTVTTENFRVSGRGGLATETLTLSEDQKTVTISIESKLRDLTKFDLKILGTVKGLQGETFSGYLRSFYTTLSSTPDFPIISDDALLTQTQEQTFRYFYDFAHPASGMARERNTSGDVVTSGGTGFGIMALIVAIERGFISRQQGIDHFTKVLTFLESADRFHGAWSHWINGNTGQVYPFSANDNGGDLVETSFLIEGLITFRQYLDENVAAEQSLIDRINVLWHGVEWDWYTQDGQNVLYWHWSPDKGWIMNHQIKGYNEALITYVLAAASPTHTIDAAVYHEGWASNGAIVNGKTFYDITLPLGFDYGGPLFFTHYSFLGLDPRTLSDSYANYWDQNVAHSRINHAYVVANPKKYVGYSDENWGLTASDNQSGYSAHSPTNDLGVITPTAALSSFPYTPEESMKALKFFYYSLGDRLWGDYGPYDAFNITEGWVASSYLAIDQGPIPVMIENYRTGLLWDLFMSAPEVQTGLTKLGFTY